MVRKKNSWIEIVNSVLLQLESYLTNHEFSDWSGSYNDWKQSEMDGVFALQISSTGSPKFFAKHRPLIN